MRSISFGVPSGSFGMTEWDRAVPAWRPLPGQEEGVVMIGATTFVITTTIVMLIAATAIADNAYPPCTQQRTDNCSTQQQAPGPTLYIPSLKGNTARHTISRATRGSGEPPDCGMRRAAGGRGVGAPVSAMAAQGH